MPTKNEQTLEQSQQGVSNDVLMEILLEPSSNKLLVGLDDTVLQPYSSEVGFITTCSCLNNKDILSIKIQESRKLKHKDKVFRKLAVENKEQQIITTADGKEFTITEASVRRHIHLANADEKGEGSGHPFESQPPPSSDQHIHEEQIPTIVSSTHQKTQTSRQALNEDIKLPQTSMPIPNVPDEAIYEEWDDSVEMATTTAASLDAAHDSGSIAHTRSEKVPTPPYDSPLPRVNTLGSDEDNLRHMKKVYGTAYTKLIMKVKKLEKTIKSNQSRRITKIGVSDDVEDSEDSFKQGRMIEDIDQDTRVTLVTSTKVSSQEDRPKDQLGVLSEAKVLVNAAKKKVNTYTRRRRVVSTSSEGVSPASRIFSIAEESLVLLRVQIHMSLDEEFDQKLYEEEHARFNAEQEAKSNAEQEELLSSETTKDEANPLVTNVDWDNV
nr:hypothetical protein [Tanacetum cinerariifolium]